MPFAHPIRKRLSGKRLAFSLLALLLPATALLTARSAAAQTFSVIHSFTGGTDGAYPSAGLTMDQAGNFYGTAALGGLDTCAGGGGCGDVFKLAPHGSAWIFSTLYAFATEQDGLEPLSRVTFGPDGKLYGTTSYGGMSQLQHGTVFSLSPSSTFCRAITCPWVKTTLYTFAENNNLSDGQLPQGDLVFDRAGNLYGTTTQGGAPYQQGCPEYGCGTVYELSPANGGWTETLLYQFGVGFNYQPHGGVIFDSAGNLYGTTFDGTAPASAGVVYELTPSGGSWSQTVLYTFQNRADGRYPEGGLIFDQAGNLYGSSSDGGPGGAGTAFELTPSLQGWVYDPLVSFGLYQGPAAQLMMDAAGNPYGTTLGGGAYGYGSVFKLTHSGSSWVYTSLHDFSGQSDGSHPFSNVVMDSAGNLYGTASHGGIVNVNCGTGCGVVWEITP